MHYLLWFWHNRYFSEIETSDAIESIKIIDYTYLIRRLDVSVPLFLFRVYFRLNYLT